MHNFRKHRRLWLLAVVALALGWFALQAPAPARAGTMLTLAPPALPALTGNAQEASAVSAIADEAGISAYFNAGVPINLDTVADQFATIEARTDKYIIGSVSVPQYNERHQVHVYVHTDGWFMAYYLTADPAAKMVDIKSYGGTSLGTKFETILTLFASEAGVPYVQPTYWDFRSPNANRMMIIAETATGGADFTVKLPSGYLFYDQSWASAGSLPGIELNGANLTNIYFADDGVLEGSIPSTALSLDVTHTFKAMSQGKAAVVLIYRVPL